MEAFLALTTLLGLIGLLASVVVLVVQKVREKSLVIPAVATPICAAVFLASVIALSSDKVQIVGLLAVIVGFAGLPVSFALVAAATFRERPIRAYVIALGVCAVLLVAGCLLSESGLGWLWAISGVLGLAGLLLSIVMLVVQAVRGKRFRVFAAAAGGVLHCAYRLRGADAGDRIGVRPGGIHLGRGGGRGRRGRRRGRGRRR